MKYLIKCKKLDKYFCNENMEYTTKDKAHQFENVDIAYLVATFLTLSVDSNFEIVKID